MLDQACHGGYVKMEVAVGETFGERVLIEDMTLDMMTEVGRWI